MTEEDVDYEVYCEWRENGRERARELYKNVVRKMKLQATEEQKAIEILRWAECLDGIDDDVAEATIGLMKKAEGNNLLSASDIAEHMQKQKKATRKACEKEFKEKALEHFGYKAKDIRKATLKEVFAEAYNIMDKKGNVNIIKLEAKIKELEK
jgi:hypothetical protein